MTTLFSVIPAPAASVIPATARIQRFQYVNHRGTKDFFSVILSATKDPFLVCRQDDSRTLSMTRHLRHSERSEESFLDFFLSFFVILSDSEESDQQGHPEYNEGSFLKEAKRK